MVNHGCGGKLYPIGNRVVCSNCGKGYLIEDLYPETYSYEDEYDDEEVES